MTLWSLNRHLKTKQLPAQSNVGWETASLRPLLLSCGQFLDNANWAPTDPHVSINLYMDLFTSLVTLVLDNGGRDSLRNVGCLLRGWWPKKILLQLFRRVLKVRLTGKIIKNTFPCHCHDDHDPWGRLSALNKKGLLCLLYDASGVLKLSRHQLDLTWIAN